MNKRYRRNKQNKYLATILSIIMMIVGMGIIQCDGVRASEDSKLITDQEIEAAYYPEGYKGYVFPVLPGSSSWLYDDFSEMIKACSISEEKLKSMSTEALIQTVLVHPFILNVYAYDSVEEGYNNVKSYCDCLQELCLRKDRVECLYDYLENHKDSFLKVDENSGNGYIDFLQQKPNSVLLLLATNEDFFNEKIKTEEEAMEAINNILQKGKSIDQENNRDVYPIEFREFRGAAIESVERTVHNVHGYSMTGYQCKSVEYWLYNDGVCRLRYLNDVSSSAKTQMNNQFYATYGLQPVNGYGPTVEYNCHSYAWNNDYKYTCWVETFNSNGFTETTLNSVNVGGNVVYYNSNVITHSAVVTGKTYHSGYNLTLTSKWGSAGLYIHTPGNCPYYYNDSSTTPATRKYYNP